MRKQFGSLPFLCKSWRDKMRFALKHGTNRTNVILSLGSPCWGHNIGIIMLFGKARMVIK